MVLPPPAAESTEGREDWREKRLEKAEQAESPKLGHLQALVQRADGDQGERGRWVWVEREIKEGMGESRPCF